MGGPIIAMLGKAIGAMLAQQVGSGLGALAGEVLTASDIGVPLGAPGKAALVPANVAAFAEGLDVPDSDVLLYLALREAAHQRLFAGVPWLRDHLIGAVTDYAQGIEINTAGIQETMEERLRGIDPGNLDAMQELMEGGLFDIPRSPQQQAALQRLEVALALVEGWVDEVVSQATAERMPDRGQAPGGRTPPPRRGWAGRGDVRLARRARAAATPAPRRLHPLGVAAHPTGRRGPGRCLDEPPPAAHRRRPRRPARVPGGLGGAGRPDRGRLRRRAAHAARGRDERSAADGPPRGGVTAHAEALGCPAELDAADARTRRRSAAATSHTSRHTPTG